MTAATRRVTQRCLTARFPSEVPQPVLQAVSTEWSKLRRGWPWAPWPHRDGAVCSWERPKDPRRGCEQPAHAQKPPLLPLGGGLGPTKACPPETWEGVQADGVGPVRRLRTQLTPLSLSFLVRDGNQRSPGTGLPSWSPLQGGGPSPVRQVTPGHLEGSRLWEAQAPGLLALRVCLVSGQSWGLLWRCSEDHRSAQPAQMGPAPPTFWPFQAPRSTVPVSPAASLSLIT